jgi:hypothetical protein
MGGILGILSLLVQVIRFLPDIVRLVKSIIELMNALKNKPGFNSKAALQELNEGVRLAKEKKDTSKLEELHRKLARYCADGNCPTGL